MSGYYFAVVIKPFHLTLYIKSHYHKKFVVHSTFREPACTTKHTLFIKIQASNFMGLTCHKISNVACFLRMQIALNICIVYGTCLFNNLIWKSEQISSFITDIFFFRKNAFF